MPDAPDDVESIAHVLLMGGPMSGARTAILDGAALTEGAEFDVASWEYSGKTERYVVGHIFKVRCTEHALLHRRVIAHYKVAD